MPTREAKNKARTELGIGPNAKIDRILNAKIRADFVGSDLLEMLPAMDRMTRAMKDGNREKQSAIAQRILTDMRLLRSELQTEAAKWFEDFTGEAVDMGSLENAIGRRGGAK